MSELVRTHPILKDIEEFLKRNSMSGTTFGLLAMRDGVFVKDVRVGRWPGKRTEERVRKFMEEYNVAQVE